MWHKKLVWIAALCSISLLTFALADWQFGARFSTANARQSQDPVVARGPTTALQALALAQRQAATWNKSAVLVDVRSIDSAQDVQAVPQPGIDGRREAWLASFAAAHNLDTRFLVKIEDGAVTGTTEEAGSRSQPALSVSPRVDSPDAIAQALQYRPSLAPGHDKSHGYQFALRAIDGHLVMSVIGAYAGYPAKVDIDATTGEPIGASAYTFDANTGGVIASDDGGVSWHKTSSTGGAFMGIAPMTGEDNTAFTTHPTVQGIEVWQTVDAGSSWKPASTLPPSAGNWAYGIVAANLPHLGQVVVVGTTSGLWMSKDGRSNWTQVPIPSGPPQWLTKVATGHGEQLLVAISAGSSQGVYASSDLTDWKQVLKGSYRISDSDDPATTVVVGELDPTQHYLLTGGGVAMALNAPEGTMRAVLPTGGEAVLTETPSDVYTLIGGEWRSTLQGRMTDISASPNVKADRVVLAASWGTGIYRSADSGRTWVHVLPSVSKICDGSGEIFALTFLSPKHVLAIVGGTPKWNPF